MRLTFLFFFIGLMHLSASVYSQTTKLSLKMRNAQVAEVLDAIERQSEFRFAYSPGYIDLNRKVDVSISNKTIDESLHEIFAGTGVKYGVYDRHIILYPEGMEAEAGNNAAILSAVQPQQQSVTGVVTDYAGQPLPGVTVLVKGTTTGTVTDINGNFSLSLPTGAGTLQFSFVGMRTQEVAIEGRTTFNIVMEEETIGLEEVVAVGYGVQKKINLTGSIAVLDGEVFDNKAFPNTIASMQGQLPGVTITRTSGAPGSEDYKMLIRGISSVNTLNPLIIVDGTVGSINDLNPNDIESISVLKDAAASSIYGSNAAGGVVLITTKSGLKDGKVSFSYSGSVGMKAPVNMPKRVDTWVEATMQNEARTNAQLVLQNDPQHIKWMQGLEYNIPDLQGISPSDFSYGDGWYIDPNDPNIWAIKGNFDRVTDV